MQPKHNRTLHALAGELVTKEHAHEYLRATAEELFRRRSLKDVTDEEAQKEVENNFNPDGALPDEDIVLTQN